MIRFFQIMLVLTITLFTVSAVETQWKTWVPEELPPRHSFASIWVEGENFTSTNSDKTFTNNGAGVLKDKACYGGAIYHISNHRPIPADGYQVRYEFEVENSGEYLLAVAGSLPSQYTSAYWYSIDGGPWQHVTELSSSKKGWANWQIIRWAVVGMFSLDKGTHEIRFRINEPRKEDKNVVFYFDAFALIDMKKLNLKIPPVNPSMNILTNSPVALSSSEPCQKGESKDTSDYTFKPLDLAQRAVYNFNPASIAEIRVWVDTARKIKVRDYTGTCFPREIEVYGSSRKTNSLDPAQYEMKLGRFYVGTYLGQSGFCWTASTLDPLHQAKIPPEVQAAVMAVKTSVPLQSLLLDFGPAAAFFSGSGRIEKVEAFSQPSPGVIPLAPLREAPPDRAAKSNFSFLFSGMDGTSFAARQLCAEFPEIHLEKTLEGNPFEEYSKDYGNAMYYVSGHPYWFHPEFLKNATQPFVVMYNGLDINLHPESYGSYNYSHLVTFQDPGLMKSWKTLLPLLQAGKVTNIIIGDHHYPFGGPVYQPSGYSPMEATSFRQDLAGTDSGVKVYDADGKIITWKFWDYFAFYNGFRWNAKDLGLKNWQEYTPARWHWNESGYEGRKVYLFNALLCYETMKFDSMLGQAAERFGIEYFPLYTGETPWHGVDRLALLRTVGVHKFGHEQFSQPGNTYEDFQDHTGEIPYTYWNCLYRRNPYSRNKLSLVVEGTHKASGMYPYYSPAFAFSQVLDLLLAGNIKAIDYDEFRFSDQKQAGSDGTVLRNAMVHATLGAAAFKTEIEKEYDTLPRKILVVGQRGLNRKDYPFTPDGLRGTHDSGLSFRGNELGAVPWLLNRLGYEFDFCDISLEGVDPGNYAVIIYDSRDLPDGLLEKLRRGLERRNGPGCLISYGVLPSRRINDLKWRVGSATGIKDGGMDIVDPDAGKPLGLMGIREIPDNDAGGETQVTLPGLAAKQLRGYQLDSKTPRYRVDGVNPAVRLDGHTLLSVRNYGNEHSLFYFNYDFGRPANFAMDALLLKTILGQYGVDSIFYRLPDDNMSVHCYTVGSKGERIVIVKDRSWIEAEIKKYMTKNGKMNFRIGPQPGKEVQVELCRWTAGELVAYSFDRNRFQTIPADRSAVDLSLIGQMSDTFVIVPADQRDGQLIRKIVSMRERLSAYLGQGIDDLLMMCWGH